MSVKIRLARGGSKHRPYYHIVIADSRSPRDGRFIEKVGHYNPMLPSDHADRIGLLEDRVKHWLSVGALPTERVARFLGNAGIIEKPKYHEQPKKSAPKKKAQERLAALKEKEEKAKAEAEKKAEEAKAAEASAPEESKEEA